MSACGCCAGVRRAAAALGHGSSGRSVRWFLADAVHAGEFAPRDLGLMLRPPLSGGQLRDPISHLHERPVERVVAALTAVRRCRRRCVAMFALQLLPADLAARVVF